MPRSFMGTEYGVNKEDDTYFSSSLTTSGGVTVIENLDLGDLVTLETLSLDGYLTDINICYQLINGWKNME